MATAKEEINFEISLTDLETKAPKELFQISKELGIKGFKDMSDLKQMIILNVMKTKKSVTDTEFYSKDFKEKKELTFREDALRRKHLTGYMAEIRHIYDKIQKLDKVKMPGGIDVVERDDPLITKINNEFDKVDKQFELKTKLLSKTPSCSLLVCGDSGAGKSSFINLLIKHDMLPTSIRSNTACQVKLTYDQRERAEIIDLEGKHITIDKQDFTKLLKIYLENFENRKQISCKCATIYLNSPILEGGLDIYDTIGLGETHHYNDELTKDLKDITGILFLLKKNNPIGDNTVGGLSKVINHMANYGIPGGSMHFIINMCDLLEGANEKDELKKNVTGQIRDKCSGLTSEITTFSTKRELFLQEHGYMSKDYEDIMTLIQQLHINSINTNTVSIFEFLFRFVWKTIEYIIESEQFAASEKVSRKLYIQKLKSLESDRKLLNQAFKKQNERFLKDKYEKYRKEVERHFSSDITKKKVVQDVVNKHSQLFGLTSNDEIDREIMLLTNNAILKNFKEFIENQNMLQQCCDKMLNSFLQQFAEHQKKKDSINSEMNRHIDSVMNYIKGDLTKIDFNDLMALPNYQRKVLQLFAPIMVPSLEFKNSLKKGFESWFSWLISKINLANIQKFYDDTTGYVSVKSASYYVKLINKRQNIRMIMECLFEAPRQVTRDFEKYLNEDMDYLAKNIDLLDDDMRNKEKVIQTYKEIKEKLEILNEELCRINLLYMQKEKTDIMREKMEIVSNEDDNGNHTKAPILSNRNRFVTYGQFKDESLTDSAILVYKNVDGKTWKDLYQEYTRHKDFLKASTIRDNKFNVMNCFINLRYHILHSINDSENLHPMFFIKGIDYSLKTHIDEFKRVSNEKSGYPEALFDEIVRIAKQIVRGLDYLHSQKLVHYDLTMNSIGYHSTYSTVKLSSISLETKVKIDHTTTSIKYVCSVSHFPKEILEKNSKIEYNSDTDMYCLGTILYELWISIQPFFNEITSQNIDTVDKFINLLKTMNFDVIVKRELFVGGFAEMIYTWSTLCWEHKLTANRFADVLDKILFYGESIN